MTGLGSGRRPPRVVLAGLLLAVAGAGLGVTPASAQIGGATPSSGDVGPSASTTSWTFDPIAGGGSGGTPLEVVCTPGQCSRFTLNVNLGQPDTSFYSQYEVVLTYTCSWTDPAPTDVDCFAFDPSGGEDAGPGSPDNLASPSHETITIIDPASGSWSLRADESAGGSSTVAGVATFAVIPLGAALVPQAPAAGDAGFSNLDFSTTYQTRDGAGRPNAGEPSLGVDSNSGVTNILYMAGNQVTRLTYSAASPPTPTTTDVTPPNSRVNEDAILFTDRTTHRTWALGLLLAGSYLSYTDDNGATWTPGAAFSAPALPDHETLGSGPYNTAGTQAPAHSYPDAVYYCAQTIVQDAYCGRSDDGGMTFNSPATPLWNGTCSPIHGHVRVGPTGYVYVPNAHCTDASGNARSGVAVSADNGATFVVRVPPDSSSGSSDPSVMEGPDGAVYFGYQAANGHPMVAVSHDHGATWGPSIDVGQFADPATTEDGLPHGVQNTEFAEVVTGDAGRAAFAFLGTGTAGAYQAAGFTGTWYLFVSYTFDGGKTWRTVNATPNDPVQRGCVWNGGLVNACRNMLDFNDIGVDKQGHVYVAYTDGCTTGGGYSCDTIKAIAGWNNGYSGNTTNGCGPSESAGVLSTSTCTFARLSAVVRQVCGRGLVAAYDPGFNEASSCQPSVGTPETPSVAALALLGMIGAAGIALVGRRRRRTGPVAT